MKQVQQMVAQQPETNAPVAESFFSEAIILEALEASNLLITEMMANPAAGQSQNQVSPRAGQALQKYAKEVAQKIQGIYKNKKAMAAGIPKFTNSVSSYLGITPQTASDPNAAGTASSTPSSSTSGASNGGNVSPSAAGASSGKGLISKVMGFVKSNPKISAAAGAALLGIVVAAFAGAAPVVVPVLLAALKGAGWAAAGSAAAQKLKGVGGALVDGGIDAAKQQFKDNKVDVGTTAKYAAIGAATGGLGKLLSIGLGNIAKEVIPQDFAYRDKQIELKNGVITKNIDDTVRGKRLNLWGHGGNYDVTRTSNK